MKQKRRPFLWIIIILSVLSVIVYGYTSDKMGLQETVETIYTGEQNTAKIETISGEKYAYSTLSEEQKTVYDQILNAILTYEKEVKVATKQTDVVGKSFDAIMADYGGLFWISGYKYKVMKLAGNITSIHVYPAYVMKKAEKEEMQEVIDKVVEAWMADISLNATDYEKAKWVYETLIQRVDYDMEAEDNQNIISVFVRNKTVCQGYANAAQYLLEQLGITSCVVTGTAAGDSHAWNLLLLDGQYYFMDVTWGNSRYLSENNSEEKFVNYNYLNITSEELAMTHTIKMDLAMPECSSVEDNYFHKEGLYFETLDTRAIGEVLRQARNRGQTVSVKFANSALYDNAKEYLIKDSNIAFYCPGIRTIRYIDDETMRVLTFQF